MSTEPQIHSSAIDNDKPTSSKGAAVGSKAVYPGTAGAEALDRRVRSVLRLIACCSACSVQELANEVHLSAGRLQRLFKQETGSHISDLLAEQKLQKAAHLLSSGVLSINEIAHAVGYNHHSSFTRAFVGRFGRSPRQYRRRCDVAEC
jgi:AraC-like DNA-binding protein